MTRYDHFLATILICVLLPACSSTPTISLPAGETIVIAPAQIDRIDAEVTTRATAVTRSAALGTVGAAGGAVVGAAAGFGAGLACGPLALICAPIAAAGGAVVGLGGGAYWGSEAGGNGVVGDKAGRFNEISAIAINEEALSVLLLDSFHDSARAFWAISEESPNLIGLRIDSIRFSVREKQRVQLVVAASMDVATPDRSDRLEVTYEGAPSYIDYWLEYDGQNLYHEVDVAIVEVAHRLVSMLVARP